MTDSLFSAEPHAQPDAFPKTEAFPETWTEPPAAAFSRSAFLMFAEVEPPVTPYSFNLPPFAAFTRSFRDILSISLLVTSVATADVEAFTEDDDFFPLRAARIFLARSAFLADLTPRPSFLTISLNAGMPKPVSSSSAGKNFEANGRTST